jgi:hypothetical protein
MLLPSNWKIFRRVSKRHIDNSLLRRPSSCPKPVNECLCWSLTSLIKLWQPCWDIEVRFLRFRIKCQTRNADWRRWSAIRLLLFLQFLHLQLQSFTICRWTCITQKVFAKQTTHFSLRFLINVKKFLRIDCESCSWRNGL